MLSKMNNQRLILLLIFISNIICLDENYEDFDYLSTKNRTIVKGKNIILLKMDTDKILSKNYAYFSLEITEPTKIDSFSFKFVNSEEEPKNYTVQSRSGTINHLSKHSVLYKIEKNQNQILLLKIEASTTTESQVLLISSTESQINFNVLFGSIILGSMLFILIVGFLSFYFLYKKKRTPEDIMNDPFRNINRRENNSGREDNLPLNQQ